MTNDIKYKTSIIMGLLLCTVLLNAQNPIAAFSVNQTSGCSPLTVQLMNTSAGAASYYWDFGNGNTSVLENPSNVYSAAGIYTVRLIATATNGSKDSVISSNLITVSANSNPNFNAVNTAACLDGNAISFVNTSSNASTYLWDFGDGATSALQQPTHTYVSQGTYTIKLVTYDSYGCPSLKILPNYIHINPNPVAEFAVNTSIGCDTAQIFSFLSTTPSATAWAYNFGDGTSSTIQNPSHSYVNPGNYTISLTATNSNGCSNTITHQDLITVETPQLPSFASTFNNGCIPVEVLFTNQTATAISLLWNFGDGIISSEMNPTHIYQSSGAYTVSLTTTSFTGCTYTKTLNNHIQISNSPVANFSVGNTSGCSSTVSFTNTSSNTISQLWEFGDGHTSTQQNPSHKYSEAGTFTVTLHSYNSSGCESVKQIPNAVNLVIPVANFTANYTPGCAPLSASFMNASENSVQWLWSFGDGTSSNLKNPSHTYNLPGNFDVTLVATDANGCSDTVVFYSLIHVINTAGNFITPPVVNGCTPFNTSFSSSNQGTVSWLWNFGDGSSSTLQNPSHTYSSAGLYTVSLVVTLNSGCNQYYPAFRMFDIKQTQANFTFSAQQECAATTVAFTGQSNSSNFWDFGDGTTSTLQSPTHIYSLSGFYTVKHTTTIQGGCSASTIKANCIHVTTCSTGGGISNNNTGEGGNVWIEGTGTNPPQPAVKACIPFDVQFNNTLSSTVSWLWNFGGGSTSTLQHPFHSYTTAGTYTITLQAQTVSGTTQTLTYANYVQALGSTADFTLIENGNCQNSAVSLNTLSPEAVSWQWDFGDGLTSSLQNPSHTYTNSTNNYIVTLTSSNAYGCTSSISKSLLLAGAAPVIWPNKYTVCANETSTFNCLPNNYTSYSWNFGDGSVSTVANPSHVYQAAGTYAVTLTVTDNKGCVLTSTLHPQINVNKPFASFNYSLTSCSSQTVNFTNTSIGTEAPLSTHCSWNFGDGSPEQWSDSPMHTFPAQGTYHVTLTVHNKNCSNSITKTIYVQPMVADFAFTQSTTCMPVSATFTDLSTGAAQWLWDFGDGSISTLKNPVHTYANAPGTEVTLTVTGDNGCQATITKTNISFFNADFGLSAIEGCAPLSVDFYDASSNANQWSWDFGDGSTSTLQHPSHTYTTNGSFIVKLISESTGGCVDTMVFDAINTKKPLANFISANPTNCSPALVTFTDLSANADSWLWDFGDGSSSVNHSPGHVYNVPGLYTIKLIVSNAYGCSDTIVRTNYIEVPGSIANFNPSTVQACAHSAVQFTDLSINASSWNWNFGDGNTSSQKNPTNIYQNPGQYTVSLIVHDAHGCSSNFTLPNPVVINPLPTADFTTSATASCTPFPVTFQNNSLNAISYSWNFGDGTVSANQNTSHTYENPGTYTATLTAANQYGCSAIKTIGSIIAKSTPQADFTMNATAGCSPLVAMLTNTTANSQATTAYHWNFGDGNTSSVQNASETYTTPGFYTISLIAVNSNGCRDTIIKTNAIQVYDFNPPVKSDIRVVTVVSDTSVQITWNQNDAADFASYKLYRKDNANGTYTAIATINNKITNTFMDAGRNTLANSYCYKVQTVDICGYTQALDSLQEHCTVNVSATGVNDDIQLNWTPYIGAIPETYAVYRLEAATQNPTLIGTVPGNNLTFIDTTLDCPHLYSYRIKANKLNGALISSNSDTCVARPQKNVLVQQKVDVVRSTVIENSKVLTEWSAPVIAPEKVAGYAIYKSEDNTNFSLVTNVDAVVHSYVDEAVDVNAKNYFYKVKALNFCDIVAADGNKSSSILLKAELIEGVVNLNWTGYEGWNMGVDYYIVQKLDENGEWKTIKQIEGNKLEYEDNN